MALLLSLILLASRVVCAAAAEENWPVHQGPVVEDTESEHSVTRVLTQESRPMASWSQTTELSMAQCGVVFQGHLQQRPYGTYLVVVLQAKDGKDHFLKWSPAGFRFDGQSFHGLTPYRSTTELKSGLVYLYSLKFSHPEQLKEHRMMQIYLPWVDDCETKPELDFEHTAAEDVDWDMGWRRELSLGVQFATLYADAGWQYVRLSPSLYLRFADFPWGRHGFSAEGHAVFTKGTVGFLLNASYAYAVELSRYLKLLPEVGYRSLNGLQGSSIPGFGTDLSLVWEVPSTRNKDAGQRLLFETGCGLQRHFGGRFLYGADTDGSWAHCRIGIAFGW